MTSAQEGGEADGARVKEAEAGEGVRACWRDCWGGDGNPAKLKLCRTRGGLLGREAEGGCEGMPDDEVEEAEEEREKECFLSSSLLWTKWQRIP